MVFTGEQVVEVHKKAVKKCEGKGGWAALECMINSMKEEYRKAKEAQQAKDASEAQPQAAATAVTSPEGASA